MIGSLQDMDLRTEKEKQRSVLIKLKEISSVDESFSSVCQQNIQKLGFTLPTASRLTSSVSRRRALASTSSAMATSSGANANLFRTSTAKTATSSVEEGAIYADLNQVPKPNVAASQKQVVAWWDLKNIWPDITKITSVFIFKVLLKHKTSTWRHFHLVTVQSLWCYNL